MTDFDDSTEDFDDLEEVAVIGFAGRFPGANNVDDFWRNLRDGVDSLREFSDEELDALGIPSSLYKRDNFVRRGTILPDMDKFDAKFFGFTPREAAMMDPQARLFLETCYSALEHAGYNPFETPVPVGVFAGSNPNDYATLLGAADPADSLTGFDQLIATDKDFLATRVSHRLNLRGPAINIQTACSTSLVTIHLAARSLLDYQCSMALAGGVSVNLRQGVGYFAQQGMILSPDGYCRAFDENANGTTLGQAVASVVLKRYSEAVADNDTIYAVVKATALNNDGSAKISYTAPSEDGQTEVITLAHALAGVSADDITYVETHGTGTKLGDPIEVAALRRAFRVGSERNGYCGLGSVKTNVGHTDAAAGVTGFLKTVLALHNKQIPASLNFSKPNPALELETSPFYVNDKLRDWEPTPAGRIAGVSSFGIGGTNAHAVLAEGPQHDSGAADESPQIVVLSARTPDALKQMSAELADWLDSDHDQSLADAAFTLQTGRGVFERRLSAVVTSSEGETLRSGPRAGVVIGNAFDRPDVVFMYSGQGAQYPSMTKGLYASHSQFRETFDRCCALFSSRLNKDIKAMIFADFDDESANETLRQTQYTQAALFTVEYAMSQQLIAWGIEPTMLLGHSIGEYAAACTADILSLEDAVIAVSERGRLMQSMQPGAMLAAYCSPEQLGTLPEGIELATLNTPALTVVGGTFDAIDKFEQQLQSKDIRCARLHTSHAFHSAMMEPLLTEYRTVLSGLDFKPPKIPIVSNVTGQWLTNEEATDPDFWCRQIRQPVRFQDCVATICAGENAKTFIEVGPGRTLAGFVRECAADAEDVAVFSAIRHPQDERDDAVVIRDALGRAWVSGVSVNWQALHQPGRRRIALPTYAFARDEHWSPAVRHVLAKPVVPDGVTAAPPLERLPLNDWLYVPSWRRLGASESLAAQSYLLIADSGNQLDELADALIATGAKVKTTAASDEAGLSGLFDEFRSTGELPDAVVHLLTAQNEPRPKTVPELDNRIDRGLDSVLNVAREIGRSSATQPVRLEIVTTGAHQVLGHEIIRPDAAILQGPAKVIPLEYSNIQCRLTDLDGGLTSTTIAQLVRELTCAGGPEPSVALRGGYRWAPDYAPLHVPESGLAPNPIRPGGTYLIVGGLGGVGLSLAQHLATRYQAKIALTSRSGRPQRPKDDSDPELSGRIDLLEQIEAAAADTMVVAVDASDSDQMSAALSDIEARLGPVNGVIVAAGVADMAGAIHNRTAQSNRASISSKVDGSFVLDRLFHGRKLDFIVLSSSIATALYHNRFAQVGYVSGNSFAEAYGLIEHESGTPIISIAWDDWMNLGMSVRAARQFAETYGDEITLMDEIHSFTPEEGVALFERALTSGQGLVYVSTTDLRSRVREDVHVVSPFLQQALDSDDGEDVSNEGETTQQTIIRIWESLLGFEGVQESDDFFELGGDSLQAARMVDRLTRVLKVDIPLNTVFDSRTPVQLAQALDELAGGGGIEHEQGDVVGQGPLSPGQVRFLGRGSPNPHHFNVSIVVRPMKRVDKDVVHRAVQRLYQHHDALRLRLTETSEGWSQHFEAADWDDRVFAEFDFSTLDHNDRIAAFGEMAAQAQSSLNLSDGPLFRANLCDFGDEGQRLLLVAHHLTTDRISLLILIDHLDVLCRSDPADAELPTKTSSFKLWSSELARFAQSDEFDSDRQYWKNVDWNLVKPLPHDFDANPGDNLNASGMSLRARIEGVQAQRLLSGDAGRVDEILLAALCRALANWTQTEASLVDVLGHGRRILGAPIDVSRTVGFFLSYAGTYVNFSDASGDGLMEQVRNGLERGWTLDVLRQHEKPEIPNAQVLFNFVGRAIESQSDAGWLVSEDIDRGPETDVTGRRDHLLAVYVETGDNVINIRMVYSTNFHKEATIQALVDEIIRLATESD